MLTRRSFIVTGSAGAAALALAWWLRGGRRDPIPASGGFVLADLDPQAPTIVVAIAPAVLDGALPTDPAARQAALNATVVNVGRAIAGLPPSAQQELGELFALLALPPARVLVAGLDTPWHEASPAAIAAFLERWRTSPLALLRTAYDALHQLLLAAWYGNPESWATIGYPGPPKL